MCCSTELKGSHTSIENVIYRLKEMLFTNCLEHSNIYIIIARMAIAGDMLEEGFEALQKAEDFFIEAANFSWNELDGRSATGLERLEELQTKLLYLRRLFAERH